MDEKNPNHEDIIVFLDERDNLAPEQNFQANLPEEVGDFFNELDQLCKKDFFNHKENKTVIKVLSVGGRFFFVIAVASGAVPLFLVATLNYVKNQNLALSILVPTSVVALNVIQSMLAADETWHGFMQIFSEKNPLGIKIVKAMAALSMSILPSTPGSVTAFLESDQHKNPVIKWSILIGAPLNEVALNSFATLGFLEGSVIPFYFSIYNKCRNQPWQSTLVLKQAVIRKLEGICQQLRDFPENWHDLKADVAGEEDSSRGFYQLLSRKNPDVKKRSSCSWFSFFGTGASIATSLFGIGSWAGYACSTEKFGEEKLYLSKLFAWPLTTGLLVPLFYLTGSLAYRSTKFIFDQVWAWWNNESISFPVSLKSFPKTTITLSFFISILACFSWGASARFVDENCPKESIPFLKPFVLAGVPLVNVILSFKLIEKMVKLSVQMWGNDDERMADFWIKNIEKMITKIKKMSPENFLLIFSNSKLEEIISLVIQDSKIDLDGFKQEIEHEIEINNQRLQLI